MHTSTVSEADVKQPSKSSYPLNAITAFGKLRQPPEGALFVLEGVEIDWEMPWNEYVKLLFPYHNREDSPLLRMGKPYDQLPRKKGVTSERVHLLWWGECMVDQCMNRTLDWCSAPFGEERRVLQFAHPKYALAIALQFPLLHREIRKLVIPNGDLKKPHSYPYLTVALRSGFSYNAGQYERGGEATVPITFLRPESPPSLTIEIASMNNEDPYVLYTLSEPLA